METKNIRTENRNLTVYVSDNITSRKQLIADGFFSERLEIKQFEFDKRGLIVSFEKENEIYHYILTTEMVIRQFLYDMNIYDIFQAPHGTYTARPEELKGKKLEVFFSNKNKYPVALSPIY